MEPNRPLLESLFPTSTSSSSFSSPPPKAQAQAQALIFLVNIHSSSSFLISLTPISPPTSNPSHPGPTLPEPLPPPPPRLRHLLLQILRNQNPNQMIFPSPLLSLLLLLPLPPPPQQTTPSSSFHLSIILNLPAPKFATEIHHKSIPEMPSSILCCVCTVTQAEGNNLVPYNLFLKFDLFSRYLYFDN